MSLVAAVAQTMSSNMAKNKKLNYKNTKAKSVGKQFVPERIKKTKKPKNISTTTTLYA